MFGSVLYKPTNILIQQFPPLKKTGKQNTGNIHCSFHPLYQVKWRPLKANTAVLGVNSFIVCSLYLEQLSQ